MDSKSSQTHYVADDGQDICVDIVEALADETGDDIEEIGPLAHVIDTTALNRLFQSGSIPQSASLRFPIANHVVTVRGTREIIIEAQ